MLTAVVKVADSGAVADEPKSNEVRPDAATLVVCCWPTDEENLGATELVIASPLVEEDAPA